MNRPGHNLLSRLNFSGPKKEAANSSKSDYSTQFVLGLLSQLNSGHLKITLPDGKVREFGNKTDTLQADIQIFDWKVFKDLRTHGDIGFAESYIRGEWDSGDLKAILELAVRNRTILEKAIYGSWLGSILYRLRHWLRDNTKSGSRKNIHAHYDLGNAFYSLWLDPSMSYSGAWFAEGDKQSLVDAQRAKIKRILDSLNTKPGDHILEIGCGWGGFAEQAVAKGAQITGLTLSPAQREFSLKRALTGGWASQADFLLTDYRDMTGQFDHIVSIEMFEAVGQRWWPTYFKTLKRLLKPGGRAVIQVITIDDQLFDQYRRNTDFIQRHVFPGGMLPSPQAFCEQAQTAGFYVADALPFGKHYAQTLALWHQAFDQQEQLVREQGFDERFMRLWRFYLAYCEAGFRSESTNVYQYTLQS